MIRPRRDLAPWALCAGLLLVHACSSATELELPTADSDPSTTTLAATETAVTFAAPAMTTGTASAEAAQPTAASGVTSSAGLRSASSDPFWFADFYMRLDSDLADMRILPVRGEIPGPLRYVPNRVYEHAAEPVFNRVYDMCDFEDLLAEARFGGPQVAPTLLFREVIPMMMQQRGLMGCGDPDAEPGEYEPRWALYGHGGSISWYQTPEQARADIARREAADEERLAHSLPEGERPLGILAPHSAIALPLPGQAADELRVVPGSVSVIDGVVRGLVRNWSRELWAYEVSVTIGDGTWHWPLSVQPGEIAPFEIEGWTGELPDPAEISIDAEMSLQIDVSRAWLVVPSPGELWHWPNGLRNEGYPAELYESLPVDEQVLLWHGYAAARFDFPHVMAQEISHPSIAEVAHLVTVPDLRGYAALKRSALNGASEDGEIIDVFRIPLLAPYEIPEFDLAQYIEITRYPFPPVENARKLGRPLSIDWVIHLPDDASARVWIGGAHYVGSED